MTAGRIALLLAGLALHSPPRDARANPVDMFGLGSRAAAMGGAATADSEDSSASYYNPAGLVRGRDLRIDLGYHYADPILRMNGHDVGVDSSHGFSAGLVAPGSFGPFRFAFGVAVSLPDQRLVRVRSLAYPTPRFIYYDNRPQRMFLSANLAIQIVPGLYIGGGVTFLSLTKGTVNLAGNVTAFMNPDDSSLVSKIDVGLFAVRYPEFGILWEPMRALGIGLSYRHSFQLDLDQQFRIDGSIGNPGFKPIVDKGYFSTHAQVSDHFQPWQLTLGFALRPRAHLLVTLDGTYARWSEYPAMQSLAIDLNIGPTFTPLVHIPPPQTYPPPGFHDIFIPRLGVEWRAVDKSSLAVDLRGGYSYEPTPAPEQTGGSNLADCDKHTFSLGAGLQLNQLGSVLTGSLSFDLHVALTYLPLRQNHKLDPLDAVGDFTADGWVPQFGATVRTRF